MHNESVTRWAVWTCWTTLAETKDWVKNPFFDKVFPRAKKLQDVFLKANVQFARGVLRMRMFDSPPDMDFFTSLPSDTSACWGVYLIVMEKEHCRPKIYVGSGTTLNGGVQHRLRQYETRSNLPIHVERAFSEGYELTHTGLLCWCPIPKVAAHIPVRALVLLLETMFALLLWPMISRTKTYSMPALVTWRATDSVYHGLCTHFPINEIIIGSDSYVFKDLSPEEIDAIEERHEAARAEQRRIYRAKQRELNPTDAHIWRTSESGEAALAAFKKHHADTTFEQRLTCQVCKRKFLSQVELNEHNASEGHRAKVAGTFKALQRRNVKLHHRRNVAEDRFRCPLCNYAAPSVTGLKQHFDTAKHSDNVAQLGEAEREAFAQTEKKLLADSRLRRSRREYNARNIAEQRFFCPTCKKAFDTNDHLERHLKGLKHIDKIANRPGPDPLKPKKFFCPECEHNFCSYDALQNHLKSQRHAKKAAEKAGLPLEQPEPKTWVCEICDHTFYKHQHYQNHLKTNKHADKAAEVAGHPVVRPKPKAKIWSCPIDDMTFVRNACLQKHFTSQTHMEKAAKLAGQPTIRPLLEPKYCPECDMTFSYDFGFQRHLKSRSHAEKCALAGKTVVCPEPEPEIHHCPDCDQNFSAQAELQNHFQTQAHLERIQGDSSLRPAPKRNYADEDLSLMQQAAKRRQSTPRDAPRPAAEPGLEA